MGGIGFELGALAAVKTLDSIHQADQPDLDQIIHLDAGRQPCHQMIGNPFDQRQVLLDQLVTAAEIISWHDL